EISFGQNSNYLTNQKRYYVTNVTVGFLPLADLCVNKLKSYGNNWIYSIHFDWSIIRVDWWRRKHSYRPCFGLSICCIAGHCYSLFLIHSWYHQYSRINYLFQKRIS